MRDACERWNFSVQTYRFLKQNYNNHISIKFEDLLAHPREILRSICSFIGISFEEQMLKGTGNKKMIPEYRRASFDLSRLEISEIPKEYNEIIYEGLKYCKYL
jgi:hypothetical protein